MIILDTTVLSEQTRLRPAQSVMNWAGTQIRTELFTTSITEAEMLLGVELMSAGRKRRELEEQVQRMFTTDFKNAVLPFDSAAAAAYATVVGGRVRAGKPIREADAQIAAIARSRGAAVATRDVADFQACGIAVINPWTA